jgi:Glycosyl transferase family 2
VRISLICPTIGRSTLERLINQVKPQLCAWDQFIVVGDGPQPDARALVKAANDDRVIYAETDSTHHWGAEQVDHGITRAHGDYLMFVGDDDELFADAMHNVRVNVSLDDPHPYLFNMMYEGVPAPCRFSLCACSGQQFVIPNQPQKIARYSDHTGEAGDWDWMEATVKLWDGRIEIRKEMIATLTQRNHGKHL